MVFIYSLWEKKKNKSTSSYYLSSFSPLTINEDKLRPFSQSMDKIRIRALKIVDRWIINHTHIVKMIVLSYYEQTKK